MRPLYLNSKGESMLIFLDGPALCVSQQSRPIQRFPFSRISRVLVSGKVLWKNDALLQCADRGITVTFLDSKGLLRACLTGKTTDRMQLAQLWNDFLYRLDTEEIYRIWSESMRNRARSIIRWRIRTKGRSHWVAYSALYEDQFQKDSGFQVIREIHRRLGSLANAKSRQILANSNIDFRDDVGATLLSDMEYALQCGLCPELITFCAQLKHKSDGPVFEPHKAAIDLFERNHLTVKFHTKDFLSRLRRHVRQVCDAR